MTPGEAYKNKIGERVTRIVADTLSQGVISEDDAREIAEYVLDNIDKAQTSGQVMDFLTELTAKWPIFDSLLTIELGQAHEQEESAAIEETEKLIKKNKIEEALKVAEQANDEVLKGGKNT